MMMACGTLATLAMTATLLGAQSLKIERHETSGTQYCAPEDTRKANAVVTLRSSDGTSVYSRKVRVSQFDFYLTENDRGGVPAKKTTVLFNYPNMAGAEIVELKMLDGSYTQTARLQNVTLGLK